ncbi:MAG: HAMP domain-containing sensor histidine kinase [Campylobacterota bacterium]|nr:HAMP domain-containing sensor histidine kinase [Campylobacterota bacterium]
MINKELENSLNKFKAVVNSTIDAMFIFENDICTELNQEALVILGYDSKQEILNKHIFDIFTHVSKDHQNELLDDKIDHMFEDFIISKSGKSYEVQIKERNILIDEKIIKIIAILDITQIKQNERLLAQQTKMASMGEMMENIAHQWRQPLTAISVAAGGIKINIEFDMEDKNETLTELDNIVKSTQFLSSTIENFQNFLKENRTTTLFKINDLINKSISIIEANLKAHNIIVIKNLATNVQMSTLENDFQQVLLNIINNASDILKQTKEKNEKKYIFISTLVENDTIELNIKDNAGGIDEDIMDKIFEPYFTTKHQSRGTGLGLYMTHDIIGKMKGSIEVSNSSFCYDDIEYKGANFKIRLKI